MEEELIAAQVPELISLLQEIPSKVSQATKYLDTFKDHVLKEEVSTDKGISLLEVKYHLLLSYTINLVQLMLHKVDGKEISEDVSVDRLVEIRTVLEKIRPLEHKLAYQIDKLIKTANTGSMVLPHPLKFKPNPGNLISKLPSSTTEHDNEQSGSGTYIPPRVHAMPYDEEGTKRKTVKKGMKRAILEEIHEISDAPYEVRYQEMLKKSEVMKEAKEKEKYEEEYFVRLRSEKRRKQDGRHMADSLDNLIGIKNPDKVSKKRGKFNSKSRKRKLKGKKRKH